MQSLSKGYKLASTGLSRYIDECLDKQHIKAQYAAKHHATAMRSYVIDQSTSLVEARTKVEELEAENKEVLAKAKAILEEE